MVYTFRVTYSNNNSQKFFIYVLTYISQYDIIYLQFKKRGI